MKGPNLPDSNAIVLILHIGICIYLSKTRYLKSFELLKPMKMSGHDSAIVDWDVKHQLNTNL